MLGENLKQARKNSKLKQEDLALKMNTSTTTISNWETEKSRPDYMQLRKLAEILHVTTDYLVGLNDNPDNNILMLQQMVNGLSQEEINDVMKQIKLLIKLKKEGDL